MTEQEQIDIEYSRAMVLAIAYADACADVAYGMSGDRRDETKRELMEEIARLLRAYKAWEALRAGRVESVHRCETWNGGIEFRVYSSGNHRATPAGDPIDAVLAAAEASRD